MIDGIFSGGPIAIIEDQDSASDHLGEPMIEVFHRLVFGVISVDVEEPYPINVMYQSTLDQPQMGLPGELAAFKLKLLLKRDVIKVLPKLKVKAVHSEGRRVGAEWIDPYYLRAGIGLRGPVDRKEGSPTIDSDLDQDLRFTGQD